MSFFFPFSHIDSVQLKTLLTVFPVFRYLPVSSGPVEGSPLDSLIRQGKVLPEYHSEETVTRVHRQVESFMEWARMHRGNEKNLKALIKDSPYFSDDADPTRIQSQLKARISRGQGAQNRPAPDSQNHIMADPLVFLTFARNLDRENERIDTGLQALEKSRDTLFSELRGEDDVTDPLPPGNTGFSDPGANMTGGRVLSWLKAAGETALLENSPAPKLLVTTSPAVFDYILEQSKDVINGLDIESIKVHEDECPLKQKWQDAFCRVLEKAIADKKRTQEEIPEDAADGCSACINIKLGIFSERTDFLSQSEFIWGQENFGICLVQLTA